MTLLLLGVGGFVVGVILIVAGRAAASREAEERRGLGPKSLDPFIDWFLNILKQEWPILSGRDSRTGERIAAAGSLLAAISVIAMLGGIVLVVVSPLK